MTESILNGKRILAVDDEPDVLETLEDLLGDYDGLVLDKAINYESGYHLIRSWTYDLVILDIMGVRGYDLLNAAVHLDIPAVMLTAHALSAESLKQSIEMGARAYIPKEKMMDIAPFLEDVLTLEHQSALQRLFERLGSFFNKRFGSRWKEDEKDFWEKVSSGTFSPDPVILGRRRSSTATDK